MEFRCEPPLRDEASMFVRLWRQGAEAITDELLGMLAIPRLDRQEIPIAMLYIAQELNSEEIQRLLGQLENRLSLITHQR